MGTHRERFLYDLATFEALLRGKVRVHSNHLMTSSCSLLFKDVEECAPTGVHDALCQGMVLYHVEHVKLLNGDYLVLFGVRFGRFEMEITALPRDLEMGLRRATSSFPAAMTALLASAQLALLASQGFLRGAIVARVLNRVALTIGEKGRETPHSAVSDNVFPIIIYCIFYSFYHSIKGARKRRNETELRKTRHIGWAIHVFHA